MRHYHLSLKNMAWKHTAYHINPAEDRGKKFPTPQPPTSFSVVTSTNVEISLWKTLWLLVLNFLPHWCKILKPYVFLIKNY